MVFEWNCGCLHLPQSALFNAVSDFGIPRGMPSSLGILGRGCLNHGDAKITLTSAKVGTVVGLPTFSIREPVWNQHGFCRRIRRMCCRCWCGGKLYSSIPRFQREKDSSFGAGTRSSLYTVDGGNQ